MSKICNMAMLADQCDSANVDTDRCCRLFIRKFSFFEGEGAGNCGEDIFPRAGDDIGFSIVFGNFGETPYNPGNSPTVRDRLVIPSGLSLRVEDLSRETGYELYSKELGRNLAVGDILAAGTHNFTVTKDGKDNFIIPPNSVVGISMLFRIL
ncbi:hypothetical protein [Clostridium algidicarnis]|uniref:hypothetical protein n=1 Tax=Clostridium algidicarnis TaxID=37659 RepID=UPI00049718E8|nr:hypothetical protein [Clostridium algidicarnis]